MSPEENKALVRRDIEAIDSNHSSNWSVIDDFLSEDFVAHNPPVPGVSLDREGMKQASEIFRNATPGTHEITLQVAEGDLVVSHIHGRGNHEGEPFGIPATHKEVKPRELLYTASATRRSSSIGRLSTWSTYCNKSARSRNRRPEHPAPEAIHTDRQRSTPGDPSRYIGGRWGTRVWRVLKARIPNLWLLASWLRLATARPVELASATPIGP